MTCLGNSSLLDQEKHGFICSRSTQSSVILPCLDWAAERARGDTAVMSTFHSELESAVLDLLIPGRCPIILVLGRRLYSKVPERLRVLLAADRLLIVSVSNQSRISRHSAYLANQYICDNSNALTVGFLSPETALVQLCESAKAKGIPVTSPYGPSFSSFSNKPEQVCGP